MHKKGFMVLGLALCVLLGGCSSGNTQKESKETQTEARTEKKTEKETELASETNTEIGAEKHGETETEINSEKHTETERETGAAGQTEAGTVSQEDTEVSDLSDGLFGVFETKTLDGEKVDQNIFAQADLNMVNIWGTFCGPCINEMPELGELAEEYAEKGVRLIGIISDVREPGNEAAEKIIETTGADYTHLVMSQSLKVNYLDQVQAVPTPIFLDREGKQVGEVCVGAQSKKNWSKLIDEMLEEVAK